MEIWLVLNLLPTERLIDLCQQCEAAGVTGVAIGEHIGVPQAVNSAYPYGDGRPGNLPAGTEFPDPLVAIAALAGATTRLRFLTNAIVGPLHHPLLLARAAATASTMSGGRLDVGLSVGWMREDFEAVGASFAHRGALLDEAIPLLRDLWTGAFVTSSGPAYRFDAIAVRPAPGPALRVFLGGHSDAALRRAARLGDGWIGVNPTPEELEAIVARLQRIRRELGVDERPFEVRTGTKGRFTQGRLGTLRDLGIKAIVVTPWQILGPGTDIYACSAAEVGDRVAAFVQDVRAA